MSSDSDGHPPSLVSSSSDGDADVGVDVVEADDTSSSSSGPIWPLHGVAFHDCPEWRRLFRVSRHVFCVQTRWRKKVFEAWVGAIFVQLR